MTTISFNNIPRDVRLEIFSHLTPQETLRNSRVNKEWREDLNTEFLWKKRAIALGLDPSDSDKGFKEMVVDYITPRRLTPIVKRKELLKVFKQLFDLSHAGKIVALEYKAASNSAGCLYAIKYTAPEQDSKWPDLIENIATEEKTQDKMVQKFQGLFKQADIKKSIVGYEKADYFTVDNPTPVFFYSTKKFKKGGFFSPNKQPEKFFLVYFNVKKELFTMLTGLQNPQEMPKGFERTTELLKK
jgi:hypothetical protein